LNEYKMSSLPTPDTATQLSKAGASASHTKDHEKRGVALSSVIAAIGLTSMKLVVGLLTGSLGILSEALHSGLDLVAALVTFFAVRASDKPADDIHQFGHGKIENLSALIETLLLLITCVWIIYEAIVRLFFRSVAVEATAWSFVIMGISIGIDFTRSRALMRVAKKHNSQALEADALHFSTDIWSSSVVILGLTCVWLGKRFDLPWLVKADAVAALIVAMIVVWVSIQLGRRSIRVLLDAAPQGAAGQIETAARAIPGVDEVRSIRVRQAGAQTFVEITIAVSEQFSVEEAHAVAAKVEDAICARLPGADVVVHVDTVQPAGEDLPAQVRAAAATHAIRVHGLSIHDVGDRLTLHVHAEVEGNLTLEAAHERVTTFESALHQALGNETEIVTHIEPICRTASAPVDRRATKEERLRATIAEVASATCGSGAVHDIHLIAGQDGQRDLSMHCRLDRETSIVEAHRVSEQTEAALRKRLPELGRIVIHVEPDTPRQ